MTIAEAHIWVACANPQIGDVIKWREPLWAAPTQKRGKPDQIGEQEITAKVMEVQELLELTVISVTKISVGDAVLNVQEHDVIKRRKSTIAQGDCHKLAE